MASSPRVLLRRDEADGAAVFVEVGLLTPLAVLGRTVVAAELALRPDAVAGAASATGLAAVDLARSLEPPSAATGCLRLLLRPVMDALGLRPVAASCASAVAFRTFASAWSASTLTSRLGPIT